MRATKEQYQAVYTACKTLLDGLPDFDYAAYRESVKERANDPDMLARWNIFAAAGGTRIACDVFYPAGMNDTHIDTVLRKVMDELFTKV